MDKTIVTTRETMNLDHYKEVKPHRKKWFVWQFINRTLFRILIGSYLKNVRVFLLKLFGADIEWGVMVYSSADIWAPWNLKMAKYSCIGGGVKIYNKDMVVIDENAVVSQGAYLCTASHDISSESHNLITAPIHLCNRSWVGTDAFVGMGVAIGDGAIVGARAAVFKDVEPWTVVGGNPAKFIKKRVLRNE